ncbi:MAG TPA: hypothetical protein VF170_15590, partial [Planctomycetaceae bacterium]
SSSAPPAPASGTSTVSTQQIDGQGSVLVDASGHTLYASDQETAAGKVLCTSGCTSFWSPLTVMGGAPTGSSVQGDLGVVTRPDGTKQVTLDGKLLYTFSEDGPGEVNGEGFQDAFGGQTLTWHVVHPDGSTGTTGSTGQSGNGTGPYGY